VAPKSSRPPPRGSHAPSFDTSSIFIAGILAGAD
jgi:hypothetical protein